MRDNSRYKSSVNDTLNIIKDKKMAVACSEISLEDILDKTTSIEYRPSDIPKTSKEPMKLGKIAIKEYGSSEVGFDEAYRGKKVAILNFASSKYAGGGFVVGAMAQEENLCHHSNLYDTLSKHESFYEYNRSHLNRGLYTDGIIYSSDVVFFKRNFKQVLPVVTDVITCPAPNRGAALRKGVSEKEINDTMERRIRQIVDLAKEHEIDVLALGAFGCGVFKNKPETVARIMYKVLIEEGQVKYFDEVVFPLLSKRDNNYEPFRKEMLK